MMISCDIILDLIPLVKDGVASEDSKALVLDHIKNCNNCREEFNSFETVNYETDSVKDKKIILAIKKSLFISKLTLIIFGAILGISLSNSMGVFYNFLIMPIIGILGLFTFKDKWYIVPPCVFFLSCFWQGIQGFMQHSFELGYFFGQLYITTIYTFLVLLGVIIAKLLKFALEKGEM